MPMGKIYIAARAQKKRRLPKRKTYAQKGKGALAVAKQALAVAKSATQMIETKTVGADKSDDLSNLDIIDWGTLAGNEARFKPTLGISTGVNEEPDSPGRIGKDIHAVGLALDYFIHSVGITPTNPVTTFTLMVTRQINHLVVPGTWHPREYLVMRPLNAQGGLHKILDAGALPYSVLYQETFRLYDDAVNTTSVNRERRIKKYLKLNFPVKYTGDLGDDVKEGDVQVWVWSHDLTLPAVPWKLEAAHTFYYKDA